ncbi:embryonic stem cell-specific 5-hydroxymethylcytosine-binding protein-like [Plakobranchus ocellatus]|uniref:Abasic site processing protein HMCES n=1 Tax=Plakobranchus ocellatus TaxID=259542 RepID=A0AAV3Z1Q3_9GAST|nr:embryonic stem cell-specific 5-hydroxymethylcytosine-binding protein-like [Plakobranchus ocellatus]
MHTSTPSGKKIGKLRGRTSSTKYSPTWEKTSAKEMKEQVENRRCVLAPADIIKACSYRNYAQKRKCPSWIQAPGGQQYTPGYNLAPGAFTPVLLSAKHLVEETVSPESSYGISDRVIMPMKWGLTPPWHQGNPYKVPYETNNCRAESMMEKKSYKVPLQRGKRCVILADGFFEWKSNKDGKQPYYFYFEKEEINGLAKQNDVREEILVKCEPPEKVKESDITDNIEFKQKIKTEILRDSFLLPEKSKDPTQTIQSENEKNGESTTSSETSVFNQEFLRTHSDLDEEQQICEEQKQQNEAPLWQGYKLLTMAGVFDVWKADQVTCKI